jgi:7-cyano-7-deazaguanine synthase
MNRSVVLLSGGMDSAVTASVAARDSDELYLLHANYGQTTEARELDVFRKLVEFYRPAGVLEVNIESLKLIGGSALTDPSITTPVTPTDGIPVTYVPFRNAHLLSIAVSWAETLHASRVYIGAVEADSSGYPDCREAFYRRFQQAVDEGTAAEPRIEIVTPVIYLQKHEIVQLGMELGTPFEHTWSCYRFSGKACGVCDSCRLRLKAFKEAGIADPLRYAEDDSRG